jgi:hypothetical protein
MDVYAGQAAGQDGAQLHDFNAGIAPSGLFWTIRIPDHAVKVDLKSGTATYQLDGVRVVDNYNIALALAGGPGVPAVGSFEARWKVKGPVRKVRDEANTFVGDFRDGTATMRWEAHTANASFVSDPANTSSTVIAMMGRERNGKFFS